MRRMIEWMCVALLAGCGAQASSAADEPVEHSGGDAPHAGDDTTRGARVVAGASPQASAAGQRRVSVRVEATSNGRRVPVGPGDTLRSGDRFVVYVRLDRDAYVHVVQFFADGTSAVLSSADGSPVRVLADAEARIPPSPDEIELDDAVGEENLYVVVSERPLGEVDASLARLVEDVRTSSQASAPSSSRPTPSARPGAQRDPRPARPAPRPEPDLLAGLSRGARVVPGSRSVEADADERGISVARFSFRHVR